MDKRTASKMNSFQKLLAFLIEKATIFLGFEPLEDDIDSFKTETDKLDKMTQDKEKKNHGAAEDKGKDRAKMALQGMTLGKKAYRWAKKNGKTDLQILFDVELKDLETGKIQDAIKLANNIYDGLFANLAALAPFRITAANLTEFRTSIDNLNKSNALPQLAIGKKKVLGQDVLVQIKKVDEIVDDMEGLIIGEYLETDATLVNEFLASRSIIDPSRRKAALSFEVVNEQNEPIALAYCDILEMADEEQYTDEFGNATIKSIKDGPITYQIIKDGLATANGTTKVKPGEKVKVKEVMGIVG